MHADVEAAWQKVVDRWDDRAGHEAFLALVTKHSEYAWAAARYKERAGDAVADKQLERIGKAAAATLFAIARTNRQEETPYRRTIVIFAVLIIMLVMGLVGVKLMDAAHPDRPRPPPSTKPGAH